MNPTGDEDFLSGSGTPKMGERNDGSSCQTPRLFRKEDLTGMSALVHRVGGSAWLVKIVRFFLAIPPLYH
jgi:hypothetical protein